MRDLHSTTLRPPHSLPPWPSGPLSPETLWFLVLAISISSFLIEFLLGGRLPALSPALAVIGMVPCGFSWLFARALFRPSPKSELWPELIVGALFMCCVILHADPSIGAGGLLGYAAEFQTLLGSAVLLLTFVEALDVRERTPKERRFGLVFAGCHVALISTALMFALPELAHLQSPAQATMAFMALMGATAAWQYRQRNPLTAKKSSAAKVVNHPELARSILHLLEDDQIFLEPEIKVASLAARLDQPDYKISQCVVNDLKHANFNQLVNAYRIKTAKSRLEQSEYADTSILVIALDCGFGSVGPFNRAFKAQTGMTPTAYRNASQH